MLSLFSVFGFWGRRSCSNFREEQFVSSAVTLSLARAGGTSTGKRLLRNEKQCTIEKKASLWEKVEKMYVLLSDHWFAVTYGFLGPRIPYYIKCDFVLVCDRTTDSMFFISLPVK